MISFCTVAMNRLDHIAHTLLKNIGENQDYPHAEFVLLDYGSTDGLEKWIRDNALVYIATKKLVYLRLNNVQFFHHSRSRNLCFLAAHGAVLCNVDADNYMPHGFAWHVHQLISHSPRTVGGFLSPPRQCNGRLCMYREDFLRIGGYDETLEGWGFEDKDLRNRLVAGGCTWEALDPRFAKCLPHPDRLRTTNMPPGFQCKKESNRKNHEISLQNHRNRRLIANQDKGWGTASLRKNFSSYIFIEPALRLAMTAGDIG